MGIVIFIEELLNPADENASGGEDGEKAENGGEIDSEEGSDGE